MKNWSPVTGLLLVIIIVGGMVAIGHFVFGIPLDSDTEVDCVGDCERVQEIGTDYEGRDTVNIAFDGQFTGHVVVRSYVDGELTRVDEAELDGDLSARIKLEYAKPERIEIEIVESGGESA